MSLLHATSADRASLAEESHNLWFAADAPEHAWFDDGAGGWFDGLAAWQAAARETDSLAVDPLLAGGEGKDAAQLDAGSPAIDAGVPVDGDGPCDGFGGALGEAPDIGAHEFGAGPCE